MRLLTAGSSVRARQGEPIMTYSNRSQYYLRICSASQKQCTGNIPVHFLHSRTKYQTLNFMIGDSDFTQIEKAPGAICTGGLYYFLSCFYRLIKARGGKAGRHTHSCRRAKRHGRARGGRFPRLGPALAPRFTAAFFSLLPVCTPDVHPRWPARTGRLVQWP